ncbi:MAG: MATE family efflux transporter [Bacteroidota bacterium]
MTESKASTELNNSIWRDIKDSLAGTERDFTQGSIPRAILVLSIPMVLEMLMESVFAVVDIFFVSKLGAQAVATVGITESLLTIIYAVAIGLAMGTTAIVSRRIGEKDHASANQAAVQAIVISFIVSLPVALLGLFFSDSLLALMGAEASIVNEYSGYTRILLATNIVIMLLFVVNAVFRGAGDAAISMRVLWLANGINIVLDPLLIFGIGFFPELGIKGAAVATVIGRSAGVLLQFYYLFRPNHRIRITRKDLVVQWDVIVKLIRISLGGIGQFIIATSSWIGLVRIMAEFGSVALAGYTIAIRVLIFSILPAWGFSNAAATLVGQNLGAGKPDRAERSTWISAMVNVCFLVFVGIAFYVFAEPIITFFTAEPEIVAIGAKSLRIICYGYLAYGFGMVIIQAFNGAGDTLTPTLINFVCFWLIEIPVAYGLAIILKWEIEGVLYSIVIAESLLGLFAIILFRMGKWKTSKV